MRTISDKRLADLTSAHDEALALYRAAGCPQKGPVFAALVRSTKALSRALDQEPTKDSVRYAAWRRAHA